MIKLQICVSTESTLQIVDSAQGYDAQLKQWIASQMEYLECNKHLL